MVKFIPCDAESELHDFSNVEQMVEYICDTLGVTANDIEIGRPHGHALLLNLSNVRLVTANQVPIGICSID